MIDCTASDEVLAEIHEFSWTDETLLVSVSIGLEGKRVYVFAAPGWRFSITEFKQTIDPLIREDYDAHPDFVLPQVGIGCWHPGFPARSDDVWLLSSLAVKEIEDLLGSRPTRAELRLLRYEGQIHREIIVPSVS